MKNRATHALLDILNGAAGALIDLDPDGKRKLTRLRGKVFCLEVTAPPLVLYLLPTERGIEFRGGANGDTEPALAPDVTLTGSAPAFARLGCGLGGKGGANGALNRSRVVVRGDAELGQAFQKILSELDLDWEELLSRRIGDTPARKVGNALRGLADWAEKSADLTRENAADYLAEEKRLLVAAPAMQRFDEALDQTRADVDRLTRRVEKLKHALDERQRRTLRD